MGIKSSTGTTRINKVQKSYHKLIVWQKLRDVVVLTYKLTEKLPKTETYALIDQMRRAVISALSNFVEGYLKKSSKEKFHFLEISETSLLELEAQSEVCLILNYWSNADYELFDKKRSEASYFLYRYKSKINPK